MARTVKLSISLPQDLIDFLEEGVKRREFASRSHGIVVAIEQLREKKKKEKRT
jgi:Arc/MetJ-type ribon-helix-helix transcriptional regulator